MDYLNIADSGAKSLAGLVDAEGRFKYRYDAETGALSDGYNILRHAGSIWAMLDVYATTHDQQVLTAARRAVTYLLNNHLSFFRDYGKACICEDNTIKLGGNALAVVALTTLYEITREPFLIQIAEQLADFMLSERTPDQDLIHKRYFESGKISEFRSMYYTGEALLALLQLYEATREARWLEAVIAIEERLAGDDYGVKEQSHWMLYALASLSRHASAPAYREHATKIARNILEYPDYLAWGRSTPIACRSEGLIAYLGMQDGSPAPLQQQCVDQVRDNLNLQATYIVNAGEFVRGGNDHRKKEVRIDYIQHNISAFLHFAQLEAT
jgi:uncharacterized protein YyaL (SSP411 family)